MRAAYNAEINSFYADSFLRSTSRAGAIPLRGPPAHHHQGRQVHSDLSWLLTEPLAALEARCNDAPGAAVQVVAVRAYRLHAVACDVPTLVVPLQGRKGVRCGDARFDCGPGTFLMAHRALQFDVENTPDRDGPYSAMAIAFPWRVVELARCLLLAQAGPAPFGGPGLSAGAVAGIVAPLRAYLEADTNDSAQIDYLALGLLVALARNGHRAFLMARDPSVAARVRKLIAAAPAQDWKAFHIEQAMRISGATLRRHLREEGTSFRAVLLDARLHAGLALLQTTRRPVKAVAAACGYLSVTSFSRAFLRRFGVEPSAVAAG